MILDLEPTMASLVSFGAEKDERGRWCLRRDSVCYVVVPAVPNERMEAAIEKRGLGGWMKKGGCGSSVDGLVLLQAIMTACNLGTGSPFYGRGKNWQFLRDQLHMIDHEED